jgi:D-hexose-6-phosphate mutarotase
MELEKLNKLYTGAGKVQFTWIETSKSFADMTPEGYKTMVCVEAVNAYDDIVLLQPGEEFNLSTVLSIDKK